MDLFAELAAVLRPHEVQREPACAAWQPMSAEQLRERSRRAIEESRQLIERVDAVLAKA